MYLFASSLLIVGAFAGQSCSKNKDCGAGEKCYYGECTLSDGPGNMCGGPGDDEACFECFECNKHETGCVPISGCESSVCEEDSDCERGQICYNNDCALPDKIPGACIGRGSCLSRSFYDCERDHNCRWDDNYGNDAGMGAKRKGGKGNRGDSSWGGPVVAKHAKLTMLHPFNIASLESDKKGLSLDADGNVEYDENGYALLVEYAEMCGGRNADQECYECFECSSGGNRCIPIEGCIPSCEVDDDCTREQVCEEDSKVCRLPGGRPCGGYGDSEDCDDAGRGASRKGGKGNRGNGNDDDDSSDDSSWGGPSLSAHGSMSLASLESDEKGLSLDADGNIEYDEDGYAVLEEYAEMCGGKNADQECYECFECSRGGNRCIPISGCVPSCEVDEDCTREQICVEGEDVCRLEGGRPGGYRDSEDNGAGMGAERKGGKGNRGDSSDSSSWGGPSVSAHATISGCCRGPSLKWENAQDVCAPVLDQIGCERKECEWVDTTDPTDCEGPTSEPKSALSAFTIASLESDKKGLSYDADGNIEYDEDGYALLVEYAEMCGGKNADQECYECFECSRGGNRCIPISQCVPSCEVDDDCTREQICVEGEDVCRLEGGRPGGYRDSEDNGAGMGAERKGGKGNRGSSNDDSSSWGGPSLSAHGSMSLAALESDEKGFSLDADGNIEYDEDGYAVLEEYAEMCGGKNADQECYACFECSRGGNRCIPISGCVPSCEVDEDCTREQICVEGEDVCRLEGGRPGGYRDSEDNGAGMGAERKGGKGNRGSSSDDSSSWGGPSRAEAVVNGVFPMEESEEQSQSVSYLVLLWCSIAAVLSFAAAWLVKYWRRTKSLDKFEEISARSSHMVIGDQVYY